MELAGVWAGDGMRHAYQNEQLTILLIYLDTCYGARPVIAHRSTST